MKDADIGSRLELVYRQHGARLWRAVFAYSGSRQIADDAVSEAFAQALHRDGALRDPLAWIWRVAFRVAAGELKGRSAHIGSDPESVYEMPEPAWEVLQALARLSRMQRASILLHHYAGYPTKDVAVILGSTDAAVRVHLSVGRRRLRALLEEETDG